MNPIIWVIFSIITLDMLGIGLIIPVIAPMVLHTDSPFFSSEISESSRILWQGLALSLYPLFQFFGAPLLGIWADSFGRKPMLLLTLLGTAIGYLLASVSFVFGIFWIFLFSRALDGFTGGNVSIANAVISDISRPEEKAKNFGMIGVAFGTGMVLGPFLGGVLSDNTLVSWFSYQTPFLLAFLLSLANIFLVWKVLPETIVEKKAHPEFSIFLGITHLFQAFSHPVLKKLFTVLFLYIAGFAFFTNFFQVFAIERFAMTAKDIGMLFAYLGVCIILAQAFFLRLILRYYTITFWVRLALFVLSLLLLVLPFLTQSWMLYPLFFCMAMCNGILFANLTTLISNEVSVQQQGEIMGIKESLQAIGNAVPALLASIIGIFSVAYPMWFAGILLLIGGVLFWKIQK